MSGIETDICVIGAGSGGLTVAAVASQMGARVVLVEKGEMGGDCLNTGCVPSKALIAAAEKAQAVREAAGFGVHAGHMHTDWQQVHAHVQSVIASIAPHDSQSRFEELGVTVIRATGRFIDRRTVQAGEIQIRARYFVLATGSSPFVPPIAGLDQVDYLTNENIFRRSDEIRHLIVIGGGPIGMEMAQAHRRLGAEVTVMEMARLLVKDDAEMAAIVIERMRAEGVNFYEGGRNLRVEKTADGIAVYCETDAGRQCAHGSHLLIATGRRANVHGLGLQEAGIACSPRGIRVDARLRTSNRRVFAIGDVASPYQFTHMAAYQAGIVIRNILFRWPARVDDRAVPWVTYTDPELAHVGMTEAQAREKGMQVRILRQDMTENDRACAERRTEGRIKVVVGRRGRVLGATIVALHAGELIQPWILAVSQGMKIGAMAGMIAPYPTLGEANKRVAGSFYADSLYSPAVRRMVRWLLKW